MPPKPSTPQEEKLKVYDLQGSPARDITLPEAFSTPVRKDVIRRAFLAAEANHKQVQGRYSMAGHRTSALSRGVGLGIARVPRLKTGERAAFAPMTKGGRITHPPRVQKVITEQVNEKERRFALRSAIAATASPTLVRERGHEITGALQVPLIVTDELQSVKRTSELNLFLAKVGFLGDVKRVKRGINRRAGRGGSRNRPKKRGRGPLIIVSTDEGIARAARNMPGVEVANVNGLTILHLAPGAHPGRLTVWSESALTEIGEKLKGAAA